MIIIITNAGIVAIEGGAAAVAALRTAGAQIADDLASAASRVDDANGLMDLAKESLLGNGLEAVKIIGAVAYGGAVTAAVTAALLPIVPLGAGAAAVGIAVGWGAGKVFEWAFDEAKEGGQRAVSAWSDPDGNGITDINYNPMGDVDVISPTIGTTPDPLVKTIVYVDPLVLDLDGDGLEITPLSQGVLFDANGDALKTGTAWVGGDDGLLVWDRNGNGSIDTGAELFGDETLLSNGQKAAHGFAALSELDTGGVVDGITVGAGEGVFDAQDAQYSSLRIWRDLNQDGISQANELQTLAQTGVRSINLASRTENTNYGDAILAQSGSFTRADGSTSQAGSFILAQNNFAREFVPIAVSDAAKALMDLKGSGWVRDLREAATLSPDLIAAFNQAKEAPTRAGFKDAVAGLLREWGNDSAYNNASKQALVEGYGLTLSDPADAQEADWMDKAIKASEADRNAYRATLNAADLAKFDAMRERMVGGLEKVYAYEAFTGYSFLSWGQIQGDALDYQNRWTPTGQIPVETWVPLTQIIFQNRNGFASTQDGYIRVNIPTPLFGVGHVETLWNRLVDDATSNLLPSVRLSKYLDMIDLNVGDFGVNFDFGRLNAALATESASSAFEGAALTFDLYKYYGSILNSAGWDGAERVIGLLNRAAGEREIQLAIETTSLGVFDASRGFGTSGNDVYLGDVNANDFSAGDGDDIFLGGIGNDTLNGNDGADTLDGGTGDDTLYGGLGNDTYTFGVGAGVDRIVDEDGTAGNTDVAVFSDVASTALRGLERIGNDLVIKYGTNDQVSVAEYFSPSYTGYKVEQFKFSDGVVWDEAGIKARVITNGDVNDNYITGYHDGSNRIYGLDGNDNLNGGAQADTLDGGAGDDTLSGAVGDDTLFGGTGNDTLSGNEGADTLDGGVDNDTLYGGAGDDTYTFGVGAGVDRIVDEDGTAGNTDAVVFSDVASTALRGLERIGNDLVIKYGTSDQVSVAEYFNPSYTGYKVEQFKFSDGVVWDCLLYTSPSPRDRTRSRMPSSA